MLASAILLTLPWIAGQSPNEDLLQASKRGDATKVSKLLEKAPSIDLNYRDKRGWSALMYAVRGGHDKTVHWLLEHGASPQLRNGDEESTLIVATKYRRGGLVRKLLEISPDDLDVVDRRGWSAYTWGVFLNFEDGVDLLGRAGAKTREPTAPLPFHRATDDGVTMPKPLERVYPQFTDGALQRGIQGEVVVEVLILQDGTTLPIRVVRRLDPELDKRAMEAVGEWRFEPAKVAEEPVEMIAEIFTSFNILKKK